MDSTNEGQAHAKFIVERNAEKDIKMRSLKVMLDGIFLLDLEYGEAADFEILSGHHVVKVTNTVYSRELEFDAKPGETVKFQAGNIMRGLGAIMFVALGIGPYNVFLEQQAA